MLSFLFMGSCLYGDSYETEFNTAISIYFSDKGMTQKLKPNIHGVNGPLPCLAYTMLWQGNFGKYKDVFTFSSH